MTAPDPRPLAQRIADTRHRLENDVDVWVATAAATGGEPYLIPLSFLWDGSALLIATPASSITSRNLQATGRARVGLGLVRDVVMIEASAVAVPSAELDDGEAAAFASKTGFDPRQESPPYLYFRLTPLRIQAWREANELPDRTLMRNSDWLD